VGDTSGSSRVELVVHGADESADITYQASHGDTQQAGGASLPWSYEYTADAGSFVYVSAQTDGFGPITCEIRIDGVQAEQGTSTGEYSICTASGTL
jgi:hypothetical protein